ncbi:hypothetical protein ACVIIV_003523 [Bradyrhizobium sp. USDA 4354]
MVGAADEHAFLPVNPDGLGPAYRPPRRLHSETPLAERLDDRTAKKFLRLDSGATGQWKQPWFVDRGLKIKSVVVQSGQQVGMTHRRTRPGLFCGRI